RPPPPHPAQLRGGGAEQERRSPDRGDPRQAPRPVIPADIAQSVRRIQVVTGRQVAEVMAGAWQSVFKGRGMEFDEVRPYVPGDDVRTIDWNVTARTGEPH